MQYKREPLTTDEADRIAKACRTTEERFVVWVLLDTGMRVSELCSLTSDRVDFQQHRVMIYGKGGPHGKRSKRRVLPLSPRAASIVESLLSAHESVQSLRLGVRTVQRIVKAAASRARIRRTVTPHVLRHTFAIEANRKGITLPAIQRLLGHDSLQTTEIYMNMSPELVFKEFRDKW